MPLGAGVGVGLGALFGGGAPAVPTVTKIKPTFGPIAGGTAVTINGSNFAGTPAVTVKGVACTSVVVVSPTTLTAVTGAMTAGNGVVTVGAGTGAKFYALAGMVMGIDSATYPNNGTNVTGDGVDYIGGLHDVATGSPGFMSAQVGGAPVITYDGSTQDHQMGTLVRAQPFSVFIVVSQQSSVLFNYIFGGSNTAVGDQNGATGLNTGLGIYAGTGPVGNNTDLPISAYGIVEWHFENPAAIQVGDGTRLGSLTAGAHGLTAGRGRAAYVDHTGRSAIRVAHEIIANTAAAGYSGADYLAALQLMYEPWVSIFSGTSLEGGFGLGQGQIDPWPMQLCAQTYNLFPVNPGVAWSSGSSARQVGTPAISKNFGYPGAPYAGVHPNSTSTISADASTEEFLAFAAMAARGASVVWHIGAPTNDLSFGVSASTCRTTLATFIAAGRAAWLAAGGLASSLKVLLYTCDARTWLTDGYGTAAAKETQRLAFNTDAVANFIANFGADDVADASGSLNDATNATNYQTPDPLGSNGIHYTRIGSSIKAAAGLARINANSWHA